MVRIRGLLPQVHIPLPQADVQLPQAQVPLLQVDVQLPQAAVPVPQADVQLPQAEFLLPQSDVFLPREDVISPQADVHSPKYTAPLYGESPIDFGLQCSDCKDFLPLVNGCPTQYDTCNACSNRLCTNDTNIDTQEPGKSCGITDGFVELTSWSEVVKASYRYCNVECSRSYRETMFEEVEKWKTNVQNAVKPQDED